MTGAGNTQGRPGPFPLQPVVSCFMPLLMEPNGWPSTDGSQPQPTEQRIERRVGSGEAIALCWHISTLCLLSLYIQPPYILHINKTPLCSPKKMRPSFRQLTYSKSLQKMRRPKVPSVIVSISKQFVETRALIAHKLKAAWVGKQNVHIHHVASLSLRAFFTQFLFFSWLFLFCFLLHSGINKGAL